MEALSHAVAGNIFTGAFNLDSSVIADIRSASRLWLIRAAPFHTFRRDILYRRDMGAAYQGRFRGCVDDIPFPGPTDTDIYLFRLAGDLLPRAVFPV